MSDDMSKDLEQTAKDIGKGVKDALNSEEAKKAQAQAKQAAADTAKKVDETLKDLQKNESVKKAEEQAKEAASQLGKGLKGLGGRLKKKADEVSKK